MFSFGRLVLLLALACPVSARAEASISFFGGASWAPRSDLTIRQGSDTDLTLHDLRWHSDPLETPIYGGARLLLWLPNLPEAGFGLDYTHAKVFAENEQSVEVSGRRAGRPVQGRARVSEYVRGLGFSHGLNFFTLIMSKRWFLSTGLSPYLSVGMGVVVPHVEGRIGSVEGDFYHFGGLAFQAGGGISWRFLEPLSIFSEYKLQRARIDLPYGRDTQLSTTIWVHQAAVGLTLSFGS